MSDADKKKENGSEKDESVFAEIVSLGELTDREGNGTGVKAVFKRYVPNDKVDKTKMHGIGVIDLVCEHERLGEIALGSMRVCIVSPIVVRPKQYKDAKTGKWHDFSSTPELFYENTFRRQAESALAAHLGITVDEGGE